MDTGRYVLSDYLDELSSKAAVPGGGGVAAISAALGASLVSMVCALTIGKEKYKEFEEDVIKINEAAISLRDKLLKYSDDDAAAFLPLSKAYSMPRKTDEEKVARNEVMQKALVEAADVPFNLIRCCLETVPLFEELLVKGSTLAISDVAVGAQMIITAVNSAILNVYINTKLFKNKELAAQLNNDAEAYQEIIESRLNAVIESVKAKVKG